MTGSVMKSEGEHRKDIVEVCRRIYSKGYVASNDGNVSVRISDEEVIATPTGMS
ncbi:TPA: class II aldolase/adducin family protein, partial [Candidatus Poribacteria bacterium]|nr:class II aldolase/adducin family protein [Candidatus Poribacteria bacterium]